MFRAKSLIQQQLRRSSWFLQRPAALMVAGTVGYLVHGSQQQDDASTQWKKTQFGGLLGASPAFAAFASTLQTNYALCDAEVEHALRLRRKRETEIIRELLLENPNLKPMSYKKGHLIHEEGKESKGLCIVLDGEISLSTGRLSVSRKHKGDIFGALSLVTDGYGPRRFTARCISPECTIVEVGQEDFDKAIAAHPELRSGLRDICLCQEFQRLIVLQMKKHFPKSRDGIKSLFYNIKYNPGTELVLTDVERLIQAIDRKKTQEDIKTIFKAMDVDGNGGLSVDEFEAIFWEI